MTDPMTLDRLELLLEEFSPDEIRDQYAGQLEVAPRCLAMLDAFDELDVELSQLKTDPPGYLRRPVTASRPRFWGFWPRVATLVASALVVGIILWSPVLKDQLNTGDRVRSAEIEEEQPGGPESGDQPDVQPEPEAEVGVALERTRAQSPTAPEEVGAGEAEPQFEERRDDGRTELFDAAPTAAKQAKAATPQTAARRDLSEVEADQAKDVDAARLPDRATAGAMRQATQSRDMGALSADERAWASAAAGRLQAGELDAFAAGFTQDAEFSWPALSAAATVDGFLDDIHRADFTVDRIQVTDLGGDVGWDAWLSDGRVLRGRAKITLDASGRCSRFDVDPRD